MNTDTQRLNFLAIQADESRTGITLEHLSEYGYRVITYHKLDEFHGTLREAIDAAMELRK